MSELSSRLKPELKKWSFKKWTSRNQNYFRKRFQNDSSSIFSTQNLCSKSTEGPSDRSHAPFKFWTSKWSQSNNPCYLKMTRSLSREPARHDLYPAKFHASYFLTNQRHVHENSWKLIASPVSTKSSTQDFKQIKISYDVISLLWKPKV